MIKEISEHLNSVEETYFEHLMYAAGKSFCMAKVSLMLLLHGFIPSLYTTEGSERIKKTCKELTERRDGKKDCSCYCHTE